MSNFLRGHSYPLEAVENIPIVRCLFSNFALLLVFRTFQSALFVFGS